MRFEGKRILITGASRRLGKAAAHAFAREGGELIIHYHAAEREAQQTRDELRSAGTRVSLAGADLSDPREAEGLLARITAEGGSPDILVNSASLWAENTLQEMRWEALESSLRLSAYAPLSLARSFATLSREEEGCVLNVLDARIADYDRRHLSYHLSKRLLADLTRIMAVEFAPHIRVNGIAPGIILAPEGTGEEQLERFRRGNLLRRLGSVEEYTEALLFLAAHRFITGQILYVDGGRALRGRMYE
jgi:hypothetical protein